MSVITDEIMNYPDRRSHMPFTDARRTDSLARLRRSRLVTAIVSFALAAPFLARADQLADVKKAGVLRAAVFDSNPPFGQIDEKTHQIVGYDVDFAKAFAEKLGVKLELVPTNPANRIPLLQAGKVDLIVADITITPERAQVIGFSTPYFVTGQQFLVPARSPGKIADYATARVGAVKGTTGEQTLKSVYPKARVISYDDIPLTFAALRASKVEAITQDSSILVGLLDAAPDKA
jgi:polar amino acid transport system substrate-binding protein